MKKKSTQQIVDLIPDVLTNTAEWLKNNFDENGQEILGKASGTIGLVVVQVKNNYVELLKNLGVQDALTKIFIKN